MKVHYLINSNKKLNNFKKSIMILIHKILQYHHLIKNESKIGYIMRTVGSNIKLNISLMKLNSILHTNV